MLNRPSGAEATVLCKEGRLHGTLKPAQPRLACLFDINMRSVQRWEVGEVPVNALGPRLPFHRTGPRSDPYQAEPATARTAASARSISPGVL